MTSSLAVATPLRVTDVGQRYGKKWVLRQCSFDLRPGAVTALIGPNGAGKSTLMSAVAGLHLPTEGRIDVLGNRVTSLPSHPRLGYLAQDKPLYRRFTVGEMLDAARCTSTVWDAAHADELVDAARLDRRQRVATLSGGQRTRLAIALTVARRPEMLLLDEPLADLDPLARLEVAQTLMAEVADTGMTVLMSSHILSEVVDLCEDVLVMGGGRITLSGPIEEVLARHRVLVGPGEADLSFVPEGAVVEAQRTRRQTLLLVSRPVSGLPDGWVASEATLEEVVVGYLRTDGARGLAEGN